jgi:hypothetical protein
MIRYVCFAVASSLCSRVETFDAWAIYVREADTLLFFCSRSNWLHRYLGYGLFIVGTLHGALWIDDHLFWGEPILRRQKETSGVAAYGVLGVLVLSSIRSVRVWWWGAFRVLQ